MPKESDHHEFVVFYQSWNHQLHAILDDLLRLDQQSNGRQLVSMEDQIQRQLLHYGNYYDEKSRIASNPSLAAAIMFFTPPWLTSLEKSFLWVGGFRPTRIFPILQASVPDMSEFQATSIESMRKGCEVEEKALELAMDRVKDILGMASFFSVVLDFDQLQGVAVDVESDQIGCESDEVELSNGVDDDYITDDDDYVTDDDDKDDNKGDGDVIEKKTAEVLEAFQGSMLSVLSKADGLRRGTVTTVVEILTPPQTVKFLVAIAKYHLGLRNWGINTHI